MTSRRIGRPGALLAAFLVVVPGIALGEGFSWNGAVVIESSVSLGDLADVGEVAPGDFGPDAVLSSDDLVVVGAAGFAVQTIFRTVAVPSVLLGWTRSDADLTVALSGIVSHSPSGYPDSGVVIAPGPSTVRITRSPARWDAGKLSVWLGREMIRDATGEVVSQLVDGAGFAIGYPRYYVSFAAGSTALIDRYLYRSRVLREDGEPYSGSGGRLAPDRLISLVRVERADLSGHDLGVFAAYYDERVPAVGRDSWYVGATGAGPVGGPVSYSAGAVVQGRAGALPPAILAFGELTTGLERPALDVGASALYGSAGEGKLSEFVPITSIPAGRVIAVSYGNLIRISARISGRAESLGGFDPGFLADFFFTPQRPSGEGSWLGVELIGRIAYRLLPDLAVRAEAGAARSPLGWTPYGRLEGRLEL